jgi:predicted dehydrogenase
LSLKFGVVGCSKVAERYFFSAVKSSRHIELGTIGSRSLEKAEKWAKRFNCENFGDYYAVLKSDVDAVYISLPISLHEEWVIKAAEHGKHVLCEKSSTTSYESAKRMVKACKENNVRLLEGFSFRFHPQHNLVLEFIKNGRLGELFNFYGIYGFSPPPQENIRWKKELGGGVLNDVTCYPVCASRIIFQSEPISVIAHFEYDTVHDVDIGNSVFMIYPDNKTAFAAGGFHNYYQSSYSIWGSNGRITMKRSYAVPTNHVTSVYCHQDDKINETKFSSIDQFQNMLEKFCNVILKKNSSDFSFEEELLSQAKVMESIRRSSKEKRLVYLDEIV